MATTFQSVNVKGSRPAVDAAEAGEVKAVRGEYDLAAALVVNDIIELVKLPGDHVPVDCILDSDDLDTGGSPALVLDAGVVSAGGAANELIDNSTVGQAGGVARMDQAGGVRIAPAAGETVYGVKVGTAPATGATTGKIGLTLYYRSSRYGA